MPPNPLLSPTSKRSEMRFTSEVMIVIRTGKSRASPSGGLMVEFTKSLYEAIRITTTSIQQTVSIKKILETYTTIWNNSSRPVAELGGSKSSVYN